MQVISIAKYMQTITSNLDGLIKMTEKLRNLHSTGRLSHAFYNPVDSNTVKGPEGRMLCSRTAKGKAK